MVKEIELYDNKKILVDFDKVKKYICSCFTIFLFIIYIILPDYRNGLGVVSLKNIIFMIVTIFATLTLIVSKILEVDFKITKYDILFIVYFILILLSSYFSEYKQYSLFGKEGRGEGIITLTCYFMCFYIFYNGFKYNEKIFDYVTCAVLILSCYGIVQALLSDTYKVFAEYVNMGYSNFGNPNMFSSFLSIFIPIYIVKYFNSEDIMNLYICGIVFSALVCTKTFGGYLTFAITFTILLGYFIIICKNKRSIISKILKLLITFFVIFNLLNVSTDNAYLKEIGINKTDIKKVVVESGNVASKKKFGSNRGYIWSLALEIIQERPVFGLGPDSFGSEVRERYMDNEEYLFGDMLTDKVHNEYLQIAVTTGIPSLVTYIIFVMTISISLLIKYIKNVKNVKNGQMLDKDTMIIVAVAASIVSYLIQAFGNISVFAVAPLFWSMLGIGARLANNKINN